MHIAALVGDDVACEEISKALERQSIFIHALRRYFLGPATIQGFVFGFASVGLQTLDLAIDALGRELSNGRGHGDG